MPAIVIPAPISSNHAAPVTAGGTGATTAAAARTNLDVYSKSEVTNAISQSTASMMSEGTITVASGVTNIGSTLSKTGNIVSFTATLQRLFSETSGAVTLCTLPVGFRPKSVVRGTAYNGTKDVALIYYIQLNGDVMVGVSPQTVDAATQNIMINASFGT